MAVQAQKALIVVTASRGVPSIGLAELWAYRELLYFLVWRDVKVRYKQTALGAAWAILQPALTMVVFTLLFNRMAGIGSDDIPYPLFSYAGLTLWAFFSQGVTQAANSVVGAAQLVTKVYFPRIIVPLAAVLAGLVDLAVSFPLLLLLMAGWGFWSGPRAFLIPVFVLLTVVATAGVGLCLAALNVAYRDVRYVVPFLVQIWLFMTPVIYPTSLAIERFDAMGIPTWLLGINPMVGAVEGFRWALLGSGPMPVSIIAASTASAFILLIGGTFYFRTVERSFADIV